MGKHDFLPPAVLAQIYEIMQPKLMEAAKRAAAEVAPGVPIKITPGYDLKGRPRVLFSIAAQDGNLQEIEHSHLTGAALRAGFDVHRYKN